ncbi:IclR family transcriptional regulator [Parapusillimonas granuli]|uniref:IclR family transcriptional regulator n=1 Tax=Parapusillimonas granuli TaxID=380911 RepID=A0A853FYC4_9BURK|nr:IclR family transcriptional regulator [Parapusillimonas granuli]MBB5214513.1 DNA-binding IclR family transcriptional regulator [Parapusillimonas granuli]MEB2398238.1 IclR family transcriptional regulator [Alcaligenaceae bacterium]NYT49079.1 IclR family transcriptional regulator [Parapusillimonas granuli]
MQSHRPPPPSAASTAGRLRPARRKRTSMQGDSSSPDFVDALARGLGVLRCFTPGVKSLGNLELAERTGLAKSTVSRIVYTLTALGYLRYDSETGRYAPGYGVLALGFGCLASLEVRQLARPLMEQLAHATGAAVALGVFDGQLMTYVDAVHGSSALYLRLPVGHRVGMDSTMGRTYLAGLPAGEREALLAKLDLPAGMPEIMRKACRDFAAGGCCYGIGDWQPGINAAAAPFTAITGEGTFVLSCGGPDTILPESRLRGEVTAGLSDIVAKLSLPATGR